MALSDQEVLEQSKNAFRQWEPLWRSNAEINGKSFKESGTKIKDIMFNGTGKSLVCCATGPSFEDQIHLLKKYRDNIEIACVDKCYGMLIENDIIPDYVFIADAAIDYEKWCKPYIDKSENTVLLTCITANPEWQLHWKGKKYFYVNKDNIQSENVFSPISGCYDVIPASSNVGNSVVVFASQVLFYDQYLLLGYDYSWGYDDNYYAFTDSDKRYWMKHVQIIDNSGRLVATSQNLLFSSRWMDDFNTAMVQSRKAKIFNCSGKGISNVPMLDLERCLIKSERRELKQNDMDIIMKSLKETISISATEAQENPNILNETMRGLHIMNVNIEHIPQEVIQSWSS